MAYSVSETALINATYSGIFIHCLMMGDELLLIRSPGKSPRLVIIYGIYCVLYCVRNSLDKLKRIQQFYSLPHDGR